MDLGKTLKCLSMCFIGPFAQVQGLLCLFCRFPELLRPAGTEGKENLKRPACSTGPSQVHFCPAAPSQQASASGGEDERKPGTTSSRSPPTSSWHFHLSPSLPSFVASLHREIAEQDVVLNNSRHPVRQLRQSTRASRARQRRQRESKRANAVVAVCVCVTEMGRDCPCLSVLVHTLLLLRWNF